MSSIKTGLVSLLIGSVLVASLYGCSGSVNEKGEKVAGLGTFSEGYRMGQLSKFSVKGLFKKSGEGTMMLGADSTPFSIRVSDDEVKTLNPWHFSSDVVDSAKFTPFIGEYVWIRYNQASVGSVLYDTTYMGQEIAPVTRKPASACSIPPVKGGVQYSGGSRVGRIVKTSYKGTFSGVKTWEVILQEGNSGNKFVEMSITDEGLYNCSVEWLKSGMQVKVDYVQIAFALSWNKTDYRIHAIKPLASL